MGRGWREACGGARTGRLSRLTLSGDSVEGGLGVCVQVVGWWVGVVGKQLLEGWGPSACNGRGIGGKIEAVQDGLDDRTIGKERDELAARPAPGTVGDAITRTLRRVASLVDQEAATKIRGYVSIRTRQVDGHETFLLAFPGLPAS
ncbi:MAG: hypothetical protein AB1486_34865 [Planctomycetota bacterium]